MNVSYLQRLVESNRLVEALYFGALLRGAARTAEAHLLLGVACCGGVRPIAEMERADAEAIPGAPPQLPVGGLVVGRATLLVHEGFYHLIEALRREPGIVLAPPLREAARRALDDLKWYSKQEMHGFTSGRKLSLREVAEGAIVLLHRVAGEEASTSPRLLETTRSMIEAELASAGGDAAFFASGE